MMRDHPLPAFNRAAADYARNKSNEHLTALTVVAGEWSFTLPALDACRAWLARMPYNSDAVEWSYANFDRTVWIWTNCVAGRNAAGLGG